MSVVFRESSDVAASTTAPAPPRHIARHAPAARMASSRNGNAAYAAQRCTSASSRSASSNRPCMASQAISKAPTITWR